MIVDERTREKIAEFAEVMIGEALSVQVVINELSVAWDRALAEKRADDHHTWVRAYEALTG